MSFFFTTFAARFDLYARMQTLAAILISVMSLMVTSKNSVLSDGTWPHGMQANYMCTYQKGDVAKGDTATLTLENMANCTVEKVEVYVKSNKNTGAGVFSVEMNGEIRASKSGSFKDWTGAFDNQNDRSVVLCEQPVEAVNRMTVQLVGTENSLHINRYVITWSIPQPYAATLMKSAVPCMTLTEAEGGAGVLLPGMPDENEWHFVGWSTSDFGEMRQRPEYMAANTRFYPLADCTLWAVYRHEPPDEQDYVTDITDGDYLYVNRSGEIALSGVPQAGRMTAASVDRNDANQVYEVKIVGTDTAYITHALTGTPIGYAGTELAPVVSPWFIHHEGDQTLFWTRIEGKKYLLWLNIQDGKDNSIRYTGLLQTEPAPSPMGLLTPIAEQMVYTCHPEYAVGVGQVGAEETGAVEFTMPLGTYELIIRNGQKTLRRQ